ncbi:MBL fold metallo-hydrolase [Iocasia frigidifontis]|uniref:MBL fold metallo-hydrolase n=1 Tax=Iocasia fonsfrigidae TaxID=2682810 RepID=A0A8A7K9V4_9FIRM|nr:MBL fold metallo-hydrolase [Iocasia fonsfrigidae]QTL98010.1 MBL fold metallo-hydrolase [Iocasia fonsfrigidae]
MQVKRIPVGFNKTNCYLIKLVDTDGLLVDPGGEGDKIIKEINNMDISIKKIILTHGHFDHIAALAYLRDSLQAEVYIHKLDSEMLVDPSKNLSSSFGSDIETVPADHLLKDGDMINGFKIIHTPGHTPGGICLYHKEEGILFSGDTIFAMGVGRTDFPGSSTKDLQNSIEQIKNNLPVETVIYPGHGPQTVLEDFMNYYG